MSKKLHAQYRAEYLVTSHLIYEHKYRGNLLGPLPYGTLPAEPCGTLDRKDGGDPYERAIFQTPTGRLIVIERETP